jgi:hypothetical protein
MTFASGRRSTRQSSSEGIGGGLPRVRQLYCAFPVYVNVDCASKAMTLVPRQSGVQLGRRGRVYRLSS